ncbi:MAG: hypothetical protein WDW38_009590 [Sanguina aurantia]
MVISDTQAAKVSANRTAAFARTGDYSSEEEEDADEEGGYAAAATNRRKRAAVPAPPVQRPAGVRSAVSACAAGAGSASCMTGHVHAVQPPGIVAMQVLARSPRAGAHPCDGPPGVSVWFDVVRPVPCGQQRLRGPGLRPPPGRNGLHQRDRVRAVFAGWGIKLGDGACLGVGAPHPATPVNPPAPRPPVSSFLWSLSLPPPAWGAGIQRHPDLHTPLPGAGTRRQQGLKVTMTLTPPPTHPPSTQPSSSSSSSTSPSRPSASRRQGPPSCPPAPAPRSSPAPLPALPTHRDPHDFATYSRPNPTTTTNNNSVNHSVNHHSSATHSQSAYPQLNNNNNNNNNNSSSSYPSIVPIPDYLLPFSTPSLSLSLEDPLLQPLNHHSQQQQQQQQQRQQDESHPPFQGGAFSHQQPHHPLLPHAHTLSHQQSPYGASHLHPALASNSTQQPHPYTAGNSGYGTHSHPQQQLPHGGPTLQQPQPRYLPTLTQDVDAFSSGHMQQQLQGGPMYPSSSSASVSGSYPATAMPASFTTGMPALFPTITSAPFNTSSLHSMPHPARPAVPHQQQQPLHRLSEPQLNPQQAPSPQPDVKHEQPGPSSSQPNPPHTSTGPLLAPAFTSTGVTLPDDSSDYANSHPASADNKYNHQETHNGGRRWPQRERRPRRSCKRARPVDW